MHSNPLRFGLLSLLSATATAKVIRIDVGKEGLEYSPNSIHADKGDVLDFHFSPSIPHNVVAGDYHHACSPATKGGFYSGITTSEGPNAPSFQVTINNTDPIWFYCSVDRHCQGGMVGVVNPTHHETFSHYLDASRNADSVASSPSTPFGGRFVHPGEESSSSADSSHSTHATHSSHSSHHASSGSAPASTTSSQMQTQSSGSSSQVTSTAASASDAASKTTASTTSTSSGAAGHADTWAKGYVALAAGAVAMLA